jgi:type II secretory pathway predicted ATPase ExeA
MYLDFFKFIKNPFHITPDPEFLFLGPSHQDAFTSIFYAVQQRNGFIVVTGEVGVGKTTIIRSYLEKTDPEIIRAAYIFNPVISFDRLLKKIGSELGIPVVGSDSGELADNLFSYVIDEYKNGHNVILIIDEAQNIPMETLQRLLILSNRDTSRDKLLQVILVGQPELARNLDLPELRQLKDRIAVKCHIDPLKPDESFAYIQYRLTKASSFHNPVFTKSALKQIIKQANGIPRTINILCDNALITAFGYKRKPVDVKIIKKVIGDLQGGQPGVSFGWKSLLIPTVVVFSVLVMMALVALLSSKIILPARNKILISKVSPPSPEAAAMREPVIEPSVESEPRAEPEPSIPVAPAAGDDESFSETVQPTSIQREISGGTQAPEAEKAPVPHEGGATVQRGIARGPASQTYRYIIQIGSFGDREKAGEMKTLLTKKGYIAFVKILKQEELGEVFIIQIPVNSFSLAATLMAQLSGEIEGEPEVIKVPLR